MTDQELMQWAVESGLAEVTDTAESLPVEYVEALAKFAGLSAERERELCAKVCESIYTNGDAAEGWLHIAADKIRARKENQQ